MTARHPLPRLVGAAAALAAAVGGVRWAAVRRRRPTGAPAVPRSGRPEPQPAQRPARSQPRPGQSPAAHGARGSAVTGGESTDLRPVDISPGLFRTGRVVMWSEGALLLGLGGWGALGHGFAAVGLPPLVAAVTGSPEHSLGLVAFGLITLVATLDRRMTLALTGVAAVGFLLLFTIGICVATPTATGPWGFTYLSSALHVALMATNLGLLMWIGGEALEGRPWKRVRRPQTPTRAPSERPDRPLVSPVSRKDGS